MEGSTSVRFEKEEQASRVLTSDVRSHFISSRSPRQRRARRYRLFSGNLIEIAAVVACELCKGREIIYDCPM